MTNEQNITIALKFIELVRDYVGSENFFKIISLNRAEKDPLICHTHDYCDANVFMARAIRRVTGIQVRPTSEKHAAIWDRAWEAAKAIMCQPPIRVIAEITGGVCNDFYASMPIDAIALDHDNGQDASEAEDKESYRLLKKEAAALPYCG